jgi:16S rRNA (uracil1498-N3)-methyltransferase
VRVQRVFIEASASPAPGHSVQLAEDTAHHILKVLRYQAGDTLSLFDGSGGEWLGTVVPEGKRHCGVHITEALPWRSRPLHLAVGIALLKGDAMDRAVQKSVELGAQAIHLLQTTHSNVHWEQDRAERRMLHLRRVVVAACEQSGARFIPELTAPVEVLSVVQLLTAQPSHQVLVLDPSGEPLPATLPRVPTTTLIGPEGGWAEEEVASFRALPVLLCRFGTQILRAETAPLAALAAVHQGWGWVD